MEGKAQASENLSSEEKKQLLAEILGKKLEAKLYPLSYAQERLWLLIQLEEEIGAAYHIPHAYRLRGDVDVSILEKSFSKIVLRHEILRTHFVNRDGKPYQKIIRPSPFTLLVIDLESISSRAQQEVKLHQLLSQEVQCPFDLEVGPLLRAKLFRLSKEEYVLFLIVHHIIFDGWSMTLFLRELMTFYTAYKTGDTNPALKLLPIQYVDYAQWQREQVESQAGEAQLFYWQEQLEGASPVLALPTDKRRPAMQTFQGKTHKFTLSQGLTQQLKTFSKQEDVTLFMTLLAAFKVLLYRYTNEIDIIVGSPVNNRTQIELEGLIGFFVNILVLRTNLSNNPSFRVLLRQVRETALAAYNHQGVPFAKLVQVLQPKRTRRHNPLFQIMFSLQNEPNLLPELLGLIVETIPIDRGATQFDLSLVFTETGQGLVGSLEYNSDLFTEGAITGLAEHLTQLLEGIVANPDRLIGALPLLTEAEQHHILAKWNNTQRNYPQSKCIHRLFEEQVERTPMATAIIFEDKEITYQELNQLANQLARYLQKLGINSETLVGIYMDRSIEMIVGIWGVLKAGGAYVPLDPDYPQERLVFMLEDTKISIVLTQEHLQREIANYISTLLILDQDWNVIASESYENLTDKVYETNLAYVIYTSGSTGQPKGTMIVHSALRNLILWTQSTFQLDETDRVLQKTPFTFDVSVSEIFWTLTVGSCLVIAAPGEHKNRDYLIETISRYRITTVHFVPSMLQIFLDAERLETCNSLKYVICSGEVLSVNLQERFLRRLSTQLHNLYGPTEATVHVTYWQCMSSSFLEFVPIGYPIANSQIYLLDAWLNPMPIGVPGEIHIGGIGLSRGYLNRPRLTAENFVPDPFSNVAGARLYKTGDLARFLPNGIIEFLGRLDFQVKVRGFRIELGEIESTLSQYQFVRESVVNLHSEAIKDARLIAYIIPETGKLLATDQLRYFLKQKLPEYMIPSTFIQMEAFPLLPNGKINRELLPKPNTSRPVVGVPFVEPNTSLEKTLPIYGLRYYRSKISACLITSLI